MNTDNARKAGYDIFKVADVEALRASLAGYDRDNEALFKRSEYLERELNYARSQIFIMGRKLTDAVAAIDGLYKLLGEAGYKPDSSALHQLEILRSQLTGNALAPPPEAQKP